MTDYSGDPFFAGMELGEITLGDRVRALAAHRQVIREREALLRDSKTRYEEERMELMASIKEAGLDQAKGGGVTAFVKHTASVEINDPEGVKKWLRKNKFNVDDYLRLDAVMVKPVLANAVVQDGEIIDGVTRTDRETLELRESKSKEA